MSAYHFPDFLDNADAYARAERFWAALWQEVLHAAGAESAWVTPWLNTTCVDGTRLRDGDPIFSAVRADGARAVRIVQFPPRGRGMDVQLNVREFDPEGEAMPVLEVFCALTHEAAEKARDALSAWVSKRALASGEPRLPAAS